MSWDRTLAVWYDCDLCLTLLAEFSESVAGPRLTTGPEAVLIRAHCHHHLTVRNRYVVSAIRFLQVAGGLVSGRFAISSQTAPTRMDLQ